jgi:polyketide cyclase/dehydrase/lipid transport protein
VIKLATLGLLVLAGAVLAVAATRPDVFRVQRGASIQAPPERIYPLIADFERWGEWSPYEKKDPGMKRSIQGRVYAWEGNRDVGAGRMEIVEAAAPSKLRLKLDFSRPFEAHNMVEFSLERKGDATRVTWDMQGPAPFISRVIGLFLDMDAMVGKDFEAGLARLKAIAEAN